MVSEDILFSSVRSMGEAIRTRKLSPVDLTETYLKRLETIGPKLGAIITVIRELALTQAKAAEKEIAAGKYRGPLHGAAPLVPAGNVTGVPALTVPNGFGQNNIPTGLHFWGAAWSEHTLIFLADAYQQATDWHQRRPPSVS